MLEEDELSEACRLWGFNFILLLLMVSPELSLRRSLPRPSRDEGGETVAVTLRCLRETGFSSLDLSVEETRLVTSNPVWSISNSSEDRFLALRCCGCEKALGGGELTTTASTGADEMEKAELKVSAGGRSGSLGTAVEGFRG